jgi:hypothetical protein
VRARKDGDRLPAARAARKCWVVVLRRQRQALQVAPERRMDLAGQPEEEDVGVGVGDGVSRRIGVSSILVAVLFPLPLWCRCEAWLNKRRRLLAELGPCAEETKINLG